MALLIICFIPMAAPIIISYSASEMVPDITEGFYHLKFLRPYPQFFLASLTPYYYLFVFIL